MKPTRLAKFIFSTRWLQAPLYFGLVIALIAYVYRFAIELFDLVVHVNNFDNSQIMLNILNLIDVVMVANLLIMVIVGGYDTFVSHLHLRNHCDSPDWLDEVNAGSIKVKLGLALVAISSIHLLATFIDPGKLSNWQIMWQVLIHLSLVASAIVVAYTIRLLGHSSKK